MGLAALAVSPTPPTGIPAPGSRKRAGREVGLTGVCPRAVVASGKDCAQRTGAGGARPTGLSIGHRDGSCQHSACAAKGALSAGPSVHRTCRAHCDLVPPSFLRAATAGGTGTMSPTVGGWQQARGTPWPGEAGGARRSFGILAPPQSKGVSPPPAHLEPSAWDWDTEQGHSQGGLPGGGGPILWTGSLWPEGVGGGVRRDAAGLPGFSQKGAGRGASAMCEACVLPVMGGVKEDRTPLGPPSTARGRTGCWHVSPSQSAARRAGPASWLHTAATPPSARRGWAECRGAGVPPEGPSHST